MLVDGTLAIGSTAIRQVAPHRALEEGLAALAGELAVVFARTLVAANHALDVLLAAASALTTLRRAQINV